ncbi:DUF7661 family protein [Pseudoalteromonas sp. S16_S37]|uniref:DUF7661 family protein n=1 Tax=Pseudoalteromonas sp. S16_S37 TaxID=2720228 RepID=UPI001680C001|nr:hypothetical protein [Pseudoalteromonas sp. S16_S37]MBD1584830.1 hypothetical protein [Pseudoalteromonas sp. S16_S37]
MYKFNVFGTVMSVVRKNDEWQLFKESASGMRARVYDVVFPTTMEPDEFAQYLDDIYHELSSTKHPRVVSLTP